MAATTDRNDPGLRQIRPDGQQESYLVLSHEERRRGFVRPVRLSYRHTACGKITTLGRELAETFARNPKFYSGTFCCHCGAHFPLVLAQAPAFLWVLDGEPVGSDAGDAAAWNAARDRREAAKHVAEGI